MSGNYLRITVHNESNATLSRFISIMFITQILLSFSCNKSSNDEVQVIPTQPTSYSITISGTTYIGNTNIPTASTIYSPQQNFQLNGTLVVSKGVTKHSRDIAIIVGRPGSNPIAGSIWFVSNTQMYITAGVGGGVTQTAKLDIGAVNVNEGSGTFSLELTDPDVAM